MTLQEVINNVNDLVSHNFSEHTMTLWVNEVENMIRKQILLSSEEVVLKYPDNNDVKLLAPSPYDKMYREYLKAMIRYENRDYQEYNNDIEQFNNTFNEYSKYYVRANTQANNKIINYW